MREPQKLTGLLNKTISRLGISGRIREAQAMGCWKKVAGEKIADHARPKKIVNGTMYVCVDSASWNQQLFYLKNSLKQKINTDVGQEIIKEIRFKVE